jgi:hypothetical protein
MSERFEGKPRFLESTFPLLFSYPDTFFPSTIKRLKLSSIISRAFLSCLPEVIIGFSTSLIVLSMRLLSISHFTPQHFSLSLSPCSSPSSTFPPLPLSFFSTNTFASSVVFQRRTNTHHTLRHHHTIIINMSTTIDSPNDTVANAAVEKSQIGQAEPRSASATTGSHDMSLASEEGNNSRKSDTNPSAGPEQEIGPLGEFDVSDMFYCQEIVGSHFSV